MSSAVRSETIYVVVWQRGVYPEPSKFDVCAAFVSAEDAMVYSQVRRIDAMRTLHTNERMLYGASLESGIAGEFGAAMRDHVLDKHAKVLITLQTAQMILAKRSEPVERVMDMLDRTEREAADVGLGISHDKWFVHKTVLLRAPVSSASTGEVGDSEERGDTIIT